MTAGERCSPAKRPFLYGGKGLFSIYDFSSGEELPQHHLGGVHQHDDRRHENGQAQEVVAPELLEEVEGIAGLGIHQEHEVGAGEEIYHHAREAQHHQQNKALGDIPGAGAQLPANSSMTG